jgi:hypothetical protein
VTHVDAHATAEGSSRRLLPCPSVSGVFWFPRSASTTLCASIVTHATHTPHHHHHAAQANAALRAPGRHPQVPHVCVGRRVQQPKPGTLHALQVWCVCVCACVCARVCVRAQVCCVPTCARARGPPPPPPPPARASCCPCILDDGWCAQPKRHSSVRTPWRLGCVAGTCGGWTSTHTSGSSCRCGAGPQRAAGTGGRCVLSV